MRDIHSDMNTASMGLPPALYVADSTPVAVDRQGYEALEIILDIAVGGITFDSTNKVEFVLTHSDVAGGAGAYDNVADADMKGVTGITNGIIKSLIAAHAAETTHRFGYIGGRRYVKLKADFSGTHGTGTGISAVAVLGKPNVGAVADQA